MVTYYWNLETGNNTNPGTKRHPFRTRFVFEGYKQPKPIMVTGAHGDVLPRPRRRQRR